MLRKAFLGNQKGDEKYKVLEECATTKLLENAEQIFTDQAQESKMSSMELKQKLESSEQMVQEMKDWLKESQDKKKVGEEELRERFNGVRFDLEESIDSLKQELKNKNG